MSLIPFILDLADELNEFSRCFVSGVDVDDFGFGMYPHELQPASPRRPRSMSQLLYLPNSRGRSHPYWRSGSRSGCSKASSAEKEAAAGISLSEKPNDGASKPATAAYSVVNKNGFQVSMNVKQFSPNELTVKTIDSCIVVEGQHDEKEDGHGVISRHFVRKYMLPKGFDPNDVLSTLSSDGILTVKAPPPTKAEEKLERCVHIQQTGPAQLLSKDGGGGGAANKEKLQIVSTAAATTTPTAAAIQPQKQPAAEEEKSTVVIERNGDANASAVEINAKRETATEPASAATSIEPMLLVANIVTPSAIDAILTASAAAVATAMEENESDNGTVADIPMTDVTVPAGVIESIVLVSSDEGAIAGSAGVAVGIVGDDIAIPTPPTAGDLVAAADAAILMAKAQCGENGNKIASEELAN